MSQAGSEYGGPVRRSTRLSQPHSMVSQSVVTTSAPTAATPSRRKRALPKVNPRKSTAYGASGRSVEAAVLTVTATGFSQAFEAQRETAVGRDDEEKGEEEEPMMSGALNGGPAGLPPLPDHHSGEESSSEDERSQPAADTSKSFGMTREAGMTHATTARVRPSRTRIGQQEFTPEDLDTSIDELIADGRREAGERASRRARREAEQRARHAQEQAREAAQELAREEADRLVRDGNRQVRRSEAGPRRAVPLPARVLVQQSIEGDVQDAFDEPKSGNRWWWVPYLVGALAIFLPLVVIPLRQYTPPSGFAETAPQTPGMFKAVGSRFSYHWNDWARWIMPPETTEEEAIRAFRQGEAVHDDILWNRMYLLNKKWEEKFGVVDDTIQGLKDHLPEQLVVTRQRDGSVEIPDEFWRALLLKVRSNDTAWNEFLRESQLKIKELRGSIDLGTSEAWPMPISREEFAKIMEKQYAELSDRVDAKVAEAMSANAKQLKFLMNNEVKKAAVDQMRLQSLALTNLIANMELTEKKANYFSPGLGARVDSSITSGTYSDDPAALARVARRLSLIPQRRPPSAALYPWQEPGECWCSAGDASHTGKAQLGVTVPKPMFPSQITIEHLPIDVVPDENIANAPRDVELWVQAAAPPTFHFQHRKDQCGPGLAGWVCLGSVRYDIHGSNHVQTFNLDGQSAVPITKAMVRIASNYGADHTCLYRIRLHGHHAGTKHEYDVHD